MNLRLLILSLITVFTVQTHAWETDQFTKRSTPINDSLDAQNQKVNDELNSIATQWIKNKRAKSENGFIRQVYKHLEGNHLVSNYETWVRANPQIDQLVLKESIYFDSRFSGSRFNIFCKPSPTLFAAGVRYGSDKPAHFFSEGYTYYLMTRSQKALDPKRALNFGISSEDTFYGKLVSGVYSSGDLIANYEGFLFYLSLFHDNASGKKSIFKWVGNNPIMQRPFDWSDHLNEFWDEALLPPYLVPALQKTVRPHLLKICEEFQKDPSGFLPKNEAALRERYSHVGLYTSSQNRLDKLCR